MHNVNLELFLVQANQQPAYQILQAAGRFTYRWYNYCIPCHSGW